MEDTLGGEVMIILLKMNNYRKCTLWVNEIGELPHTRAESVIEKTIPSTLKRSTGIINMAVELFLPKNHSNYALVGFQYKPYESNNITRIIVNQNNEHFYYPNETLAMPNDKVLIGISEEYGQSVLESAVETINNIGGFPF